MPEKKWHWADSQLTPRVYRRRPERVEPGKLTFE
jgi:hypothetical protein